MKDSDNDFLKFMGEEFKNTDLSFLLITVREKFKLISELYNISLEAYLRSQKENLIDSSFSKNLNTFIEDLQEASRTVINQMDLIMGEFLEEEDDDEIDPLGEINEN